MLKLKRINHEDVQPVKFHDEVTDKRPIRGANLFPKIYANIFICARKKSGKTCAIAHIIEHCSTSETRVIAFVSTLNRDPTWRAIEKRCAERNIDFTGYTSIKEGKMDILEAIITALDSEIEGKEEPSTPQMRGLGITTTPEDLADPKTKKKKIPKEKAPEIIFVFDDLSGELLSPSVTKLLKKNRHYKSKVIVSSQYWNDVHLQGRKQFQFVMIYKGLAQSLPKLEDIYRNCDLTVPFDVFVAIYRYCTADKFHFMYVNVTDSVFRKDFTHEIDLPKEVLDRGEQDL